MTCNAEELAESLLNGNHSTVREELNACSKVQVLEFVEAYADMAGWSGPTGNSQLFALKNAITVTKKLLSD